jgi:hypothetical protein
MQKTLRAATLALGAFALAGLSAPASAAWTFSNDSGGDGSITGSYPAFTITGSNNGVGDNTSFYLQSFTTSAIVTFSWQYASLDTDSTAWDQAGFIDNGDETQLSVNGPAFTPSSGSASVLVEAGHTFGFYVHSTDSLGGPALFAVNQDLVLPPPPPPPAIPEPQAPALLLAGLVALFAAARRGASRGE